MTGSMRSTPISTMESITSLQTTEERRENKILSQYTQIEMLKNHPLYKRVQKKNSTQRLQRSNFIAETRNKLKQKYNLDTASLKKTKPYNDSPPFDTHCPITQRDSLAGINEKLKHDTNTLSEMTINEIDELYPSALWIRASLAGINEKLKHDTNTLSELAINEIDELYPSALWIRAYTDGSSQIHCLRPKWRCWDLY